MTEGSLNRTKQAQERAGQEWLDTLRSLAEQIKKQQTSQQMTQELMNTYMQLLGTPLRRFRTSQEDCVMGSG